MTKPLLISLSPNTQSRDTYLAWRVLFSRSTWINPSFIQAAEEKLTTRLNQPVIATTSGRQALYHLLQAHNIGLGDEVIIQAFTCIAVPASIIWAGAKPVYADINPDNYNLDIARVEQRVTPKTKAIIVQHAFGIPGPLAQLKALCAEKNLILIEDCALSLGATFNNQPIGTFGHSAIFSFGRDKTISSIFGGAATSQDPGIMEKLRSRQNSLSYPPANWVRQQLLHPIFTRLIVPTYFFLKYGQALLVMAQKTGLLSKAYAPGERAGQKPDHLNWRYSPALAQLLLQQLDQLDNFTQHRQVIARQYINKFKNNPAVKTPLVPAHANPNWLRFPIQVKDPKKLYAAAKRHHIILGDWYNSPLLPADCQLDKFYYQPGSCPIAESVAKKIINLPTHIHASLSDASRLADLINQNT